MSEESKEELSAWCFSNNPKILSKGRDAEELKEELYRKKEFYEKTLEEKESHFAPLYPSELPLTEKIETVAKEIYGAKGVNYTAAAKKQLAKLTELGFGDLPVCMAKTQYSLSDDPALLGRPENFDITVREAYVSAGAGFVVVLTGAVMTMPGLPKQPAAFGIDVDESGKITGLF